MSGKLFQILTLKRILYGIALLLVAAVLSAASSLYMITGRDVGGTSFPASIGRLAASDDTLSPPLELFGQGIDLDTPEDGGLCSGVNALPNYARGWPLYYIYYVPNCFTTVFYPSVFILNTILIALFELVLIKLVTATRRKRSSNV